MRAGFAILCAALAAGGCKKKSTGPGGGGGGGGWLVGEAGLMVNVHGDELVGDYDIGATERLDAIACRGAAEAWVVGEHGTVLTTADGGQDWLAVTVPTSAHLRTVSTQDAGPVFVAGDGTFLVTVDAGASWTELGDGTTRFRSTSAAFASTRVFAVDDGGGLWAYDDGVLARRTTLPGARAVHQAPAGDVVMVAGLGIHRSLNGGATWQPLAIDPDVELADIRVAPDGSAVAVGARGAIATIDRDGAVTVQYVGAASLHTLHTHHGTTGYAAGDGGQVLVTDDGGRSWRPGPNVGRTVRGVDEIGFGHR